NRIRIRVLMADDIGHTRLPGLILVVHGGHPAPRSSAGSFIRTFLSATERRRRRRLVDGHPSTWKPQARGARNQFSRLPLPANGSPQRRRGSPVGKRLAARRWRRKTARGLDLG